MVVAAGRRGGGAAGQNGANGAERDVLRETKTVLRERVVAGRGEWVGDVERQGAEVGAGRRRTAKR